MTTPCQAIISRRREELAKLKRGLRAARSESDAQKLLERHDWVFLSVLGSAWIVPQMPLRGGTFVPDFVAAYPIDRPGVTVTCVELKRPRLTRVFTKTKIPRPNADLATAISQVRHWAALIDRDRVGFLQDLRGALDRRYPPPRRGSGTRPPFQLLYRVRFLIVAGHRGVGGSNAARELKSQLALTMPNVDIMSYSHLIERAERMLDWLCAV